MSWALQIANISYFKAAVLPLTLYDVKSNQSIATLL